MMDCRAESEKEGINKIKHLISKGAEIVSMSSNTPEAVDYDRSSIGFGGVFYRPALERHTQEIRFDNGEVIRFENLSKNGTKKIKRLYKEYKKGNKMSKYRNIKIHVPTPEISEKVQKKLFEDGGFWAEGGTDLKGATYPYLYVSYEGEMSYGKLKEIFFGAEHDAVHYQSILDPYYDVKIAWANGEAVQYRFKGDNDWFDWNPKASIHIGRGEEWRIKPKTKTIKQWEQKYMLNCIKEVLTYQNTDKQKVIDETKGHTLIGDIYEAEYEVPND